MASRLRLFRLSLLILLGVLIGAWTAFAGAPGDGFGAARRRMVEVQLRSRDIVDRRVLSAMEEVPRHLFVPEEVRGQAYDDHPLPIGAGQTISQPYIVGLMTQLLGVKPGDRILEIGTGSGYQAAVLARVASEVYTIEIVRPLGEQAGRTLSRLGYSNVHTRIGDGYQGWPEAAPFDGIVVTAAPSEVPQPLLDQLAVGGNLVVPVGDSWQDLKVYTKQKDGSFHQRKVLPVRFVPMTGEAQKNGRGR
jgi:protein-L-isoaspartate(D-aspartate) O-methyltransferase